MSVETESISYIVNDNMRTSSAVAAKIPSTMRCVAYSPEQGLLRDRRIPVPSAAKQGTVLVKVLAAGLNPVDAKNVLGDKLPDSWRRTKSLYQRWFLKDHVVGFDFAGVVVQGSTGNDDKFRDGDRVFGDMPPLAGSLSEYVRCPTDQLARMPSSATFEEAAAVPLVGLTALQCLGPHLNKKKDNQKKSILVVGGSGGTGHVALQMARHCLQADHVVTLCSEKQFDFCRKCGATECIDYRRGKGAVLESLRASPARPFDFVMDCVTSGDPRDQANIDYPAMLQDAEYEKELLQPDYIYRRLGGVFSDWLKAGLERTTGMNCWRDSHEKLFWIRFPQSAGELEELATWVDEGKLKIDVPATNVYDFNAAAVEEAFTALNSRRVKGKVVVRVAAEGQEQTDEQDPQQPQQQPQKKKQQQQPQQKSELNRGADKKQD